MPLGRFIRARREAITPEQVGLPAGARRRTPGLRRAELAQLAGISVDYLIRLERGSDRHPSGQVLGALADALHLGAEERVHLHRLVKAGIVCPQSATTATEIRPTVLALLDRLEPTPAYVTDASAHVLAHTEGFRRLAEPVGLLDAPEPNLARFVFADVRARAVFPNWAEVADERAAALRAAADLGDYGAVMIADELSITVGAEFRTRYAKAAVLPSWTGVEVWAHPEDGELRLAYESLALPGADEQRLVAYLPVAAAVVSTP